MDWKQIGGLAARHILTTLAGSLATHGLLAADGSETEAFVGAGLLGIGMLWSVYQKYAANKVTAFAAKAGVLVHQSATVTEAAQAAQAAATRAGV